MTILLTGAAGFIGYHTAQTLLARGETVVGVDNVNAYYDVRLKEARLAELTSRPGFSFHKADIGDRPAIEAIVARHPGISRIIHLAAQAGVRHSLVDPYAYVQSNLMGQVVLLEAARHLKQLDHFVYASSSSVYGDNKKLPFAIDDVTDTPLSLYGATKKADELMTYAYTHLFRLPATGLRFFTVYGPWGRPDMAAFLFTKAIFAGEPIKLFNAGNMRRDFTYVDDIVRGVVAALDRPPADRGADGPPHRVYNLGNSRAEELRDFIAAIERATNKKAIVIEEPMQAGDVRATWADVSASERDLGFKPSTSIDVGIPNFVAWYRQYHGV
ncbi:MAG: GDP-mannose 4,6-dehydratase [Alphaproteobacteria bacterium]|nr:GDP-mannose 4,6-dehydratase [Alphaproteobacteria bacterium]